MELYKHNQEAYDAIMEAFEAGHQRVAIVQATGTGKGVVGAKVCESFKKVMMLSPSEAIIEQNLRYNTDIEAHTYAWAMVQTTFGTDYDLIWLDEYHRAGAERWGEGIELLISLNPEANLTKRLDESSFELIRDTAAGYEKLADFRKDHPNMEQYARHHGWLKQLGLKTRVVRYTDEALIAEGSKYATSSEFRAANSTMYSLVKGRGLLNKIFNNL